MTWTFTDGLLGDQPQLARQLMSALGPTLPTLAVQQDGSYLGCTGNRLTYGPARRRIGSDNGRSRIPNPALIFKSTAPLSRSKIGVNLNLRRPFSPPTFRPLFRGPACVRLPG